MLKSATVEPNPNATTATHIYDLVKQRQWRRTLVPSPSIPSSPPSPPPPRPFPSPSWIHSILLPPSFALRDVRLRNINHYPRIGSDGIGPSWSTLFIGITASDPWSMMPPETVALALYGFSKKMGIGPKTTSGLWYPSSLKLEGQKRPYRFGFASSCFSLFTVRLSLWFITLLLLLKIFVSLV